MKAVIFLGQKREMAFKALERMLEGDIDVTRVWILYSLLRLKSYLSFVKTKQTDKKVSLRKDKNRKKSIMK